MSKIEVYEDSSIETLWKCLELAREHYYEVEEKSSTIPFNLNMAMVEQLANSGMLRNVVAVRGGEIVGYFANIISPCIYTSRITAKELGIFLHPSARGGSTFYRMLKLTEHLAKEAGCYSQMVAFKEGHDVGLAQRAGYTPTETVYHKLLGE